MNDDFIQEVNALLDSHMNKEDHYHAAHLARAKTLWEDASAKDELNLRKAQVYAAAVEYCIVRVNELDPSQRQIASKYGVASSSVSSAHRAIVETLVLKVPGDDRYTVAAVEPQAPESFDEQIAQILPVAKDEVWTLSALAIKSSSPFARVFLGIHDGKALRHTLILGGATTQVSAAEMLLVHLHIAMLEPAKGLPRRPGKLRFVDGVELADEVAEIFEALEIEIDVLPTARVIELDVDDVEGAVTRALEPVSVSTTKHKKKKKKKAKKSGTDASKSSKKKKDKPLKKAKKGKSSTHPKKDKKKTKK